MKKTREKHIVESFLEHLGKVRGRPLRAEAWPDEENRNTADIDAIAGPYAIEHTVVESFENQLRELAWYRESFIPLIEELRPRVDSRLEINLPREAIGFRDSLVPELRDWVLANEPGLDDGVLEATLVRSGIGIRVSKSSGRKRGVHLTWWIPGQNRKALTRQLQKKISKLARYREKGKTTILLVESDDLQSMNSVLMEELVQGAVGPELAVHVDELWYADTSIPGSLEFEELAWSSAAESEPTR